MPFFLLCDIFQFPPEEFIHFYALLAFLFLFYSKFKVFPLFSFIIEGEMIQIWDVPGFFFFLFLPFPLVCPLCYPPAVIPLLHSLCLIAMQAI